MKSLKILIILILTLLYGCGYNPINQISDKQVSITKYSLNGNSEINRYLKLNFDWNIDNL